MLRHLRPALLFLSLASSVALAVPRRNFEDITKELKRTEEQTQYWLKPDASTELRGDFVARLQKEAAGGGVKAQATLGLCYQIGFGVKRDLARAIEWYEKAAAGGHAGAQNNLGIFYEQGIGVPKNTTKSHQLYLSAAEQGFVDAEFNVALDYANGVGVPQDWTEARGWYEKAAAHGSLTATTNLGNIYLLGRGVPVDLARARSYLQKAAEAGVPLAQCNLGVCYAKEHNLPTAATWFRRSAEAGYAGGQAAWATSLTNGEGVPKNPVEGLKWARRAAANFEKFDRVRAADAHAMIAEFLVDEPGIVDPAGAFREAKLSAETGCARGQAILGLCYQRGAGVHADSATAAVWFRRSAEQNFSNGATNLGVLYEQGKGVPEDRVQAVKWYRVAAETGDPQAAAHLGLCYRDGAGVEPNLPEAAKWFRVALAKAPTDRELISTLEIVERRIKAGPKSEADLLYDRAIARVKSPDTFHDALDLLNQAAALDQPYAIVTLANLYRQGTQLERDEARADALLTKVESTTDPELLYLMAEGYFPADKHSQLTTGFERFSGYLRRAAVQGHRKAQNALGYFYMSSPAGYQDVLEAFRWLSLSAANGSGDAQANLNQLTKYLTPAQIEEGTRRFHESEQSIPPSAPR